MSNRDACRCELVWDMERFGTAETPGGETLEIGESGPWTPGRLLSLAAQSSLMVEFLRLTEKEDLPILGYVSSGESVFTSPDRAPELILSPCVVVGDEQDSSRAERLLEEALEVSPICRLLRGVAGLDARIVVVKRIPA